MSFLRPLPFAGHAPTQPAAKLSHATSSGAFQTPDADAPVASIGIETSGETLSWAHPLQIRAPPRYFHGIVNAVDLVREGRTDLNKIPVNASWKELHNWLRSADDS